MAYTLKAEGTTPFDLSEETVEKVAYANTSADDSNARARDNYATLTVSGRVRSALDGDLKDSTVQTAKWSLIPAVRADAYQKITATCVAAGQITRKYEFSQGFVVSYEEHFSDQAGVGTFKAQIRQKKDQIEKVSVTGGYAAE